VHLPRAIFVINPIVDCPYIGPTNSLELVDDRLADILTQLLEGCG
jgi:hypothetical protein